MSQPRSKTRPADRKTAENPLDDYRHSLIVVDEWLPGNEPTDYAIDLTDGPDYLSRYYRCRLCGQERNRRSEFTEQCEVEKPPTPLSDGGYSIEEARTRRALTEDMEIRFGDRGPIYEVTSESGNTYNVDIEERTCSCPDFRTRQPKRGCKHIRRVDLEIGARQIPQPNGTFLR